MTYVPHTERETREMLAAIGVGRMEDLFADVPAAVRFPALELPPPSSEMEITAEMQALAGRNFEVDPSLSFLGAGAYNHFRPATVDYVLRRGEFYTSYTQYQPEASQGMLQALFEYQSMICRLTGMEVSNASHYDGATALAEAVVLALNVAQGKRSKIIMSPAVHPQYRAVVRTYLRGTHAATIAGDEDGSIRSRPAREAARWRDRRARHPESQFLRPVRAGGRSRRGGPSRRSAADRGDRSDRARPVAAAGRLWCRRRGRGRAAARDSALVRRAASRHLRVPHGVCAAAVGPSGRRDRRCGRPARLCAHPRDARAAHPPRQGDEQHLHQFRGLRPCGGGLSRDHGQAGPAQRRRAVLPQEPLCRRRDRPAEGFCGKPAGAVAAFLQGIRGAAAARRRPRSTRYCANATASSAATTSAATIRISPATCCWR